MTLVILQDDRDAAIRAGLEAAYESNQKHQYSMYIESLIESAINAALDELEYNLK